MALSTPQRRPPATLLLMLLLLVLALLAPCTQQRTLEAAAAADVAAATADAAGGAGRQPRSLADKAAAAASAAAGAVASKAAAVMESKLGAAASGTSSSSGSGGGGGNGHKASSPESSSGGHPDGSARPPDLSQAVTSLKHANWTGMVTAIRDPSNRGYLVGFAMVASLTLCLAGYKLIKICLWLFLGGFISISAIFYIFAPNVFDTDVCCGPGTEQTHALISACLGVIGGILALWVLKIGIFLTGSCLGLGVSLAARSLVGHLHLFQGDLSFAVFYATVGLVGGLLSLYKEKPIIVTVTAAGGSLCFFLGVSYFFDECDFGMVVYHVEEEMKNHPDANVPLNKCNRTLAGLFLALSVIGILVQYNFSWCRAEDEDGKAKTSSSLGGSTHGRHGARDSLMHHRAPEVIVVNSSSSPPRRRREEKRTLLKLLRQLRLGRKKKAASAAASAAAPPRRRREYPATHTTRVGPHKQQVYIRPGTEPDSSSDSDSGHASTGLFGTSRRSGRAPLLKDSRID